MMQTRSRLIAGLTRVALRTQLAFLLAFVALTSGAQQGALPEPAFDPLRPPGTSSPRDTLRSFQANVAEVVEAIQMGELATRNSRAYLHATEALDFSSTPGNDAWWNRTERVLLLKELLDRVEIPPYGAIPGIEAVAGDGLTQWTIPDTRITIARVAEGPRSGEFLFSHGTVENLDRMYANAKQLPYRPGATGGYYEEWRQSEHADRVREQQVRDRLRPVDTSNPRSTLEGFLDSMNRAYQLVMEAEAALASDPPGMTLREAREVEVAATNHLDRAVQTLDLSQVSRVLRRDVGAETALKLKEIFDRLILPPLDTVPNARMVQDDRDGADGPVRWRFPHTEIEIVEVLEGDRRGQFLFSAATVSRTGEFYAAVEGEAYRAEMGHSEWLSPGKSEGFYSYYAGNPGYMIPRVNFLGRLVAELPPWTKVMFRGETLWQWIGLILSLLAILLVSWITFRYGYLASRKIAPPLDDWLAILTPVIIAVITAQITSFIDQDINFTGELGMAILTSGSLIVIAMTSWAVYLLCRAIAETLAQRPRVREQSSEVALFRIAGRVCGFIIAAWMFIHGIRLLGADLIPLLAGLGVGGLALALAAQNTIANFIGSIILYINKPVRVGEFCRYGEDPDPGWLRIGTVEEIGLLSTRIRGIDRTLTTIPNAEFSKLHIVNLSKRDERLLRTRLQLRYETTPDQLRYILTKLRELLLGHPMVTPEPARVRFVGFAAYSLDVEIFAYLRCVGQDAFLAIQEDLFLRMADIVTESGSGFAFPSQTAYIASDSGIDEERRESAEEQINQQRALGQLPFPDFEEEDRDRLEDILDYPPKGSQGYDPR